MEDCRKLIFKLWFKNGMYIEKEVNFDENTSKETIGNFVEGIRKMKSAIKTCFKEDIKAEFGINNMIVRCSELIAFDVIPIIRKESEE